MGIDAIVALLQSLDMPSILFNGVFLPWVRRAASWLFLPSLAVVAWGELVPHPPTLPGPWEWDKADHLTAYFGLALLGTLGWGLRRSVIWALLGVVTIGGSLEGLQALVGRDANWGDMFANSFGAVAGFGLACAYLAVPRCPKR